MYPVEHINLYQYKKNKPKYIFYQCAHLFFLPPAPAIGFVFLLYPAIYLFHLFVSHPMHIQIAGCKNSPLILFLLYKYWCFCPARPHLLFQSIDHMEM